MTLTLVLVSFRPDYSIDDITGAMRSGNINKLSRYLDSRVDISLPEKSDTYSKSQAEMVLKNFFTTHQPKGFTMAHQGASPEGAKDDGRTTIGQAWGFFRQGGANHLDEFACPLRETSACGTLRTVAVKPPRLPGIQPPHPESLGELFGIGWAALHIRFPAWDSDPPRVSGQTGYSQTPRWLHIHHIGRCLPKR